MQVNGSNIHLALTGKHAVIGGHDDKGIYNIGRINIESKIKIGKVAAFWAQQGNANLYYVDRNQVKTIKSKIMALLLKF